MKRFEWLYHFLGSKKFTLSLFAVLCVFLIPRTLIKTEDIYLGRWGSIIFGFMGLNLVLCTVQRIKTLTKTVIVIHSGILMIFAGVVISSFGYVATVNIYEGTKVDKVYRWDIKKNVPLGVDLMVKKVNVQYYPVDVKVGVLRGQEKFGLFTLKTGESFQLEQYTVKVDALELLPLEKLDLSVFNREHLVGTADTLGENTLPADFPFEFKLVAYKNTSLKRLWVDLRLSRGSEVVIEGTSEVNHPLTWGEFSFYHTKADIDKYGLLFAGIQITNDPGIPYVYTGFVVTGIGSLMFLFKRLYGYR
ncbi:MAG: ResB-like family cytochrome C biogenesis protein [Nitrospiraceae bacterium]|nr:MAG: ResB-like family cytochrome C biogenesis protein [Nitrospiraceae bacterium]